MDFIKLLTLWVAVMSFVIGDKGPNKLKEVEELDENRPHSRRSFIFKNYGSAPSSNPYKAAGYTAVNYSPSAYPSYPAPSPTVYPAAYPMTAYKPSYKPAYPAPAAPYSTKATYSYYPMSNYPTSNYPTSNYPNYPAPQPASSYPATYPTTYNYGYPQQPAYNYYQPPSYANYPQYSMYKPTYKAPATPYNYNYYPAATGYNNYPPNYNYPPAYPPQYPQPQVPYSY
ncbi:hypothetical protein CHUAL_012149 [Chamberlinius hualienensis]